MKKFVFTTILVILLSNTNVSHSQSGCWKIVKTIPRKIINIVTDPKFVAVLDYAASYMHVYYDASTDAVFWQVNANRDKSIPEINEMMHGGSNLHNIHYYKNMSRLALVLKGYCIGMSIIHVKKDKLSWQRLLKRELGMLPMMSTCWQLRYKYCRYGKAWDISKAHNQTRYVIPTPLEDIKIGLEGREVSFVNVTELFISSYYLASDIYDELKDNKLDNTAF